MKLVNLGIGTLSSTGLITGPIKKVLCWAVTIVIGDFEAGVPRLWSGSCSLELGQ